MLDMTELADRIRTIIEATGLSNSEIAAAAKRTPAAVTQWLSGDVQKISADSAFALADRTGFEARWILFGEGPQRLGPINARERALLDHYRQVDEKDRRMVERVAEAAADYKNDGDADADDRPVHRMKA